MNEISEVGNSVRVIKAKKDVHSNQVKDNKRLWDELKKTKNTIIKLQIDNFKQLFKKLPIFRKRQFYIA